MKLIVMTDVHGNLPALQAALAAIQREGYDLLFHLGDVVGIGPFPSECLDALLNVSRIRFVMGNHDAWFANGLPVLQPDWMSDDEVAHHAWTHVQIDPNLRTVVAQWPYQIQEQFEGVPMTFTHYRLAPSGRNFVPIIREPTTDDLNRLFSPHSADVTFYGHHHPFSDVTGAARYVNPGSLGCFAEPVARYSVVTCHQGNYEIEHRAVRYEDHQLFAAFEERQVPAREFLYRAMFGARFGKPMV